MSSRQLRFVRPAVWPAHVLLTPIWTRLLLATFLISLAAGCQDVPEDDDSSTTPSATPAPADDDTAISPTPTLSTPTPMGGATPTPELQTPGPGTTPTPSMEVTPEPPTATPAVDLDHDGYSPGGGDCDDTDAAVYPDALEVCDGKDNDCDGDTDEGVEEIFYLDGDGDGYGTSDVTTRACVAPDGFVSADGDCDDSDASVYPGTSETCDGRDNDCDGEVDEGVQTVFHADADGDGYGDPVEEDLACEAPDGYVLSGDDCDDADAEVFPGNPETCDGKDNDCDGEVDSPDPVDGTTWYADADGDLYGDPADAVHACDPPDGYVVNALDCDDADPDTYPGVPSCPWLTTGSATCLEILEAGQDEGDGYYLIDPDGQGAFAVYCDMTTDGGGWTLVTHLFAGGRSAQSIYRDERFFHQAWLQFDTHYQLATNSAVTLGGDVYGMLDSVALFDLSSEVRYSCEDTTRFLFADAIWAPSDEEFTALLDTLEYSDQGKTVRFARNVLDYSEATVYPTATRSSCWGCWHICGGCPHVDTFEWAFQLGLCHNGPDTSDTYLVDINQIAIGYHDGYEGLRLECTADTTTPTSLVDGTFQVWLR